MIWLIAIACLVVGVVLGEVLSSRSRSSASRVADLENQIRELKDNHVSYRDNVSDHFSMTADLVQHMTESYREVYQHLATGAQDLCTNEVASKLLPAGSDAVFDSNEETETTGGLNPPKDYAAKQDPTQKGALSEDFGINKSISDDEIKKSIPDNEIKKSIPDNEIKKPIPDNEIKKPIPDNEINKPIPDNEINKSTSGTEEEAPNQAKP